MAARLNQVDADRSRPLPIPTTAYPPEFAGGFPLAVLDLGFRFVDANDQFVLQVGATLDELRGGRVAQLWDVDIEADAAEVARRLEAVRVYAITATASPERPDTPAATLNVREIHDEQGRHVAYALTPTTETTKQETRKVSLDAEGLQLSFDQIAVGMLLTGLDGYVVKCNPAMARLFGRTLEEIATTEVLAMMWPDDRDAVIEQAVRLLTGEIDSYSQESRLLAGDGSPVWVHETATCVRDADGNPLHFMSQFVDIGDRKRAEDERNRAVDALIESQSTIRFLFDGTPIPLVQLDAALEISAANAALAHLLGRDPIGLSITEVVHPEDMVRLAEEGVTVAPDTDWIIDIRLRCADGSERLVRSHGRIHHDDDGVFRSATASWHDITDAKQQEERLKVQASTDPLTGLPHRATFLDRLTDAVGASATPDSVAVLFIDLDHFKPVNDRYGHEAGDHLLCQVARRLRGCVRSTDVVARLGGDEFVIMVDLSVSGVDPMVIGQRIVDRLAHPFASSHGTLRISVSVGLAHGGVGSEPREIVHRADLAAYQAKRAGGSRLILASA